MNNRSQQELSQSLEKYDITVVYGRFDIKTSIVDEVVKLFPAYSQIDRKFYSFPACAIDNSNLIDFISKVTEALVI